MAPHRGLGQGGDGGLQCDRHRRDVGLLCKLTLQGARRASHLRAVLRVEVHVGALHRRARGAMRLLPRLHGLGLPGPGRRGPGRGEGRGRPPRAPGGLRPGPGGRRGGWRPQPHLRPRPRPRPPRGGGHRRRAARRLPGRGSPVSMRGGPALRGGDTPCAWPGGPACPAARLTVSRLGKLPAELPCGSHGKAAAWSHLCPS
mmetsp:Transcript_8993/g.28532  ORF Transcript_8993/g.28532 Transcript_8993/m.28532 type:complete len:201 (+) Transcript_8993:675-1277(+)